MGGIKQDCQSPSIKYQVQGRIFLSLSLFHMMTYNSDSVAIKAYSIIWDFNPRPNY